MPVRTEIEKEIAAANAELKKKAKQANSLNAFDVVRRDHLKKLADYTGRDTIVYASAFTAAKLNMGGLPGFALQISLKDVQGFMGALKDLSSDKLDLIIHSSGGQLEAAEQIVGYLRKKYSHIRAIVPQNAMSAACMLCCACDEIVMGKHSALGPTDPQVGLPSENGDIYVAPAKSILAEVELAKAEVKADPSTAYIWATKIKSIPIGALDVCKMASERSVQLVTEWLKGYMFNGEADADAKAAGLATWLGDTDAHKSHGRPIDIDLAKQHGLKVTALEDDQEFQELVLSAFHAIEMTLDNTECVKMIENHRGRGSYIRAKIG